MSGPPLTFEERRARRMTMTLPPDKGVQRFFDNVDLENAETEEEIHECLEWTCSFCRGHAVPTTFEGDAK
jgi:hypothetical protein